MLGQALAASLQLLPHVPCSFPTAPPSFLTTFTIKTQVRSLTAIDLSQGMLEQARARAAHQLPPSLPLTFLQADATSLPLPDASFDCFVDTFR